jgi:hypothetical protein
MKLNWASAARKRQTKTYPYLACQQKKTIMMDGQTSQMFI